jgi:L(+)-tartrate dehydratase beta subunit
MPSSRQAASHSNEPDMTHYVLDMPASEQQVRALRAGDTVTLNQTLFGIRDATLIEMFDRGRTTRFNLKGHAVLHTAPNVRKVDPRPGNSSGYEPLCIGTTTSMRMERFTKPLMQRDGVRLIIGKGGMGTATLGAFKEFGGAYLAVVGGAAALETTWIETIEEVDMDDLHPESLWKFRIKDFGPLLVTMDSHGQSLHADINAEAASRRAAVLAGIGST